VSVLELGVTSTSIPIGIYDYSWMRHSATSQKVAGSISDEVMGFVS
jgi:hypothetical protein